MSDPTPQLPDGELLHVRDLSRVALAPGDVLIVRVQAAVMDDAYAEHIKAMLGPLFPGNKILLMPDVVELAVLRPTREQDA